MRYVINDCQERAQTAISCDWTLLLLTSSAAYSDQDMARVMRAS